MPMTIRDASTQELMEALLSRCNPAIFIGTKNEGGDDGGRNTFWHSRGHPAVCYGLCHELAFVLLANQAKKI